MIGELGLRYRPSAQADLAEHAASLALLATDVADIPPDYLERAINEHVRRSPYMPKASELTALAQGYLPRSIGKQTDTERLQCQVEHGNRHLREIGRTDCRWTAEGGSLKLVDA